ncbi:MAG: hypothetical protein ACTSU5_18315 [Promethearchaeota archaeon]
MELSKLYCPQCQQWYETSIRGNVRCPVCRTMLLRESELGADELDGLWAKITQKSVIEETGEFQFKINNYWFEDWKFDTPLVQLVFWASILFQSAVLVYSFGFSNFLKSDGLLIYGIECLIFSVDLFFLKKIPKKTSEFIKSSKGLFLTEEKFEEYARNLEGRLFSKSVKRRVLLVGIFVPAYILLGGIPVILSGTLNMGTTDGTLSTTNHPVLAVIYHLSGLPLYFVWAATTMGALSIVVTTFGAISKLGKEYRLKLSFIDLKLGSLHKLGSIVISMGIPSILLSTGLTILGLLELFWISNLYLGVGYLLFSVFFNAMFVYLTYKSTIDVHEAITIYKLELKKQFKKEINRIVRQPVGEIDFKRLEEIHDFFDEVDKINDWPLNPTSMKKFGVTMLSSIVPIVLSPLGF